MGDIAALVPRASAWPSLSMDDWADMFSFGNLPMRLQTTLNQNEESIGTDFAGLVLGAYRSNPVVFGLELKRLALFQQAEFAWRRFRDRGLFRDGGLRLLQRPEIGESTQDLLYRILISADFGGSAFIIRRPDRLVVPRPDWVTMVLGSRKRQEEPNPLDIELIGLIYEDGGPYSGRDPVILPRREFAHYAPVRDPLARYRGIPWPIAALREIQADKAAALHKLAFFEHGATSNLVVTLDPTIEIEKARKWIELFEQEHKGVLNAYKTMYFGGGASATVVGADFQQMDFKVVQGAGQTVIAAASGIHPTIAALSEGLQGSSLNAGNFKEAAQLTGDAFLRPEWGRLSTSLEVIIPPPDDAELWYDESRVSFLKEDVKDAAEVLNKQATAIRTLTDGGYKPDTVVRGVTSGNISGIEHAGYLPVQVQPIQAQAADDSDPTRQAAALPPGPMPQHPVPQLTAGDYSVEVRCPNCDKLVAKRTPAGGGVEAKCKGCGTLVAA